MRKVDNRNRKHKKTGEHRNEQQKHKKQRKTWNRVQTQNHYRILWKNSLRNTKSNRKPLQKTISTREDLSGAMFPSLLIVSILVNTVWTDVQWDGRGEKYWLLPKIMSLHSYPLSVSRSSQPLNNLGLYSTAGDKVNQTAEYLTETEGGNVRARYLTLCDKQNTPLSLSIQRGQFPRLQFQIKL